MYNQFNPYNQYYNQPRYQQPIQSIQQVPPIQPIQPLSDTKPIGLQGKLIDSIEVTKAMDINLDGSISYFPLTDGSAIITKQLQADRTRKTIIYKHGDERVKEVKYIAPEELDKAIKKIDLTDIKDDIKSIKKQIKDFRDSDD